MAKKNKVIDEKIPRKINEIIEEELSSFAEKAYLEYAMSVVKGRAIPFVEDGLKPVHRRILYAMDGLKVYSTTPPKKAARIVGETLGLYHPHGDMSVFDALVRMAQPFSLRYPLIDGQGNFGSRDGDSAAAPRYVECRLRPISDTFLDELSYDCVDMMKSYDNSGTEPRFLPARLPFILLNGNPGIGVGIASEMPSHNMPEVVNGVIAYLKDENISIKGLMKYIKGPDFPTSAQIISSREDIFNMYNTGRGPVRLRSKYVIENPDTKNWKLVFNEIPYGVSVKNIMEQIDKIFNPEPKEKNGKKIFSPEQLRLKALFGSLIDGYNDESDKTYPVRIVIDPKSFKQDPEELVTILLGATHLECNFNANMTLVGRDGKPCQKNLLEIVTEWSDFRLETIERRVKFQLNKIETRLHILDGRRIALTNLEKVLKIIKESDEPKLDLIKSFKLSEIQAEDILELKFRQVNKLQIVDLEKEHKDLTSRKASLKHIISSRENLKTQAILELEEDKVKYGDKRLTEIRESEKTDTSIIQERSAQIAEEPITVAISQKGWIKIKNGHKLSEDFSFKEGDIIDRVFLCKNTDTLAIFDATGRVYNYNIHEIPKEGAPLNTLINLQAKYELCCPINKDHKYLLAHDKGYGFIVTGENLMTRQKIGKEMFGLPAGAKMFQPLYFNNSEIKNNMFLGLVSTDNKLLFYPLTDVNEIGKGKGVGLMKVEEKLSIKNIKLFKDKNVGISIKSKSSFKIIKLSVEEFDRHTHSRSVSARGKIMNIKDKLSDVDFAEAPDDKK